MQLKQSFVSTELALIVDILNVPFSRYCTKLQSHWGKDNYKLYNCYGNIQYVMLFKTTSLLHYYQRAIWYLRNVFLWAITATSQFSSLQSIACWADPENACYIICASFESMTFVRTIIPWSCCFFCCSRKRKK